MVNAAWAALLALVQPEKLTPYTVLPPPQQNILRQLFNPAFRQLVGNWDAVARVILRRLQHDTATHPGNAVLLADLCALPDTPANWQQPSPAVMANSGLLVPLTLRLGDQTASFLSTVTMLGTAQDITLQELHSESFYPPDDATEQFLRSLGS